MPNSENEGETCRFQVPTDSSSQIFIDEIFLCVFS